MKDYTLHPHPPGWQAVIDAQNAAYPKCAMHNAPAVCDIKGPRCLRCIEEDQEIRRWLISTTLVSGGLK